MSSEKSSEDTPFKLLNLPLELLVLALSRMTPSDRATFAKAGKEKISDALQILNEKYERIFAEEFPQTYESILDKEAIQDWKDRYDQIAEAAYLSYDQPYEKFYTAVKKRPFDIDDFHEAIDAINAEMISEDMAGKRSKLDYLKKFFSISNAFEFMTPDSWTWKYRQSSHVARDVLNSIFEILVKPNCDNDQYLFMFAMYTHQSLDAVKAIALKIDINVPDSKGNTPLHSACQIAEVEFVRLVLERNATVNIRNAEGDTPLHIACRAGSAECVTLLLEHNAEVEMRNRRYSPLHIACKEGAFEVAEILVNAEADVNSISADDSTPLGLCCLSSDTRLFNLLLAKGADINLAFLHACGTGNLQVVKKLLEYGANVHAEFEDMPLTLAWQNGHNDVIRALLDAGAKVEYYLFKKILKNRDLKLASEILSKKLITDYRGLEELLETYTEKNDEEIMALLSSIVLDPELPMNRRREVRLQSANKEQIPDYEDTFTYLEELLTSELGAENDALLEATVRLKHPLEIPERLFDEAFRKAIQEYGMSANNAILLACQHGQLRVVELLLDHGADVNVLDRGYTPLELAYESKQTKIVDLLLDEGATVGFSLLTKIITARDLKLLQKITDKGLFVDHEKLVKLFIKTSRNAWYFSLLSKAVDKIPLNVVIEILRNEKGKYFAKISQTGHKNIIDALILLDKEYQEKLSKSFPLWYAAIVKKTKSIEKINWKAEYDLMIEKGLSQACEYRAVDVVKELLDAGIKPVGRWGVSAFGFACKNGPLQAVDLLIRQGADVNAKDQSGYVPLIYACSWTHKDKDNKAIVALLLKKGADKHIALVQSCLTGQSGALSMLLGMGADIKVKDDQGRSLMDIAYADKMRLHRKEDLVLADKIIEILLNAGAKVDRPLFEKMITDGQLELADKILQKKATTDDEGLQSLLDDARDVTSRIDSPLD